MQVSAPEAGRAALDAYAAPGRSALVRIRASGVEWEGGVDPDRSYRVASLLKLGIAIAVEDGVRDGRIDPDTEITVRELDAHPDDHSVTDLLNPATVLRLRDTLALMVGASDNTCARWLSSIVGLEDDPEAAAGQTTCRDALDLLRAAADRQRYPITSHALRHSIRNSRIPLGATDADMTVAHKTGTLSGLAHDVAIIECDAGVAEIAFLTDQQHDTLVTGYAMGICTREVLTAWGLAVRSTVSVDGE
ncbi:MAG: class A beta-lactamase-related serine hydrolase [Actinobacteria bacterium]|nr:class A beta-lactamase-related serine hydrolase [Actinomycetota bacterium]